MLDRSIRDLPPRYRTLLGSLKGHKHRRYEPVRSISDSNLIKKQSVSSCDCSLVKRGVIREKQLVKESQIQF
ncbi:hypothetical protein RMSM_05690 [Rhodopirellula maiorica SM1]|uniref:Uncharacterized protein n=1 Tax=Rhodopirellula maiorica SM1 TaxID=1265738 RepID=M5RE78_9BACT|nr:hypothetical protein RMSM_05690 [Rhodopirellula maiorica SM1]